MLPKKYFMENFANKENLQGDNVKDPLIDSFNLNLKMDIDNYKYSNNIEFESIIKECLKKSIYFLGNDIFVGKLANPYPNCYNVNDDNLKGCLICITSGLTENSYVLAKYYALNYLIDYQSIDKNLYEAYKLILKNDLIRRINTGYGSQIEPGDLLYYAELLLNQSGIYNLLKEAANFSVIMDIFIIYHEYSHYLLKTIGDTSNICVKQLILKATIVYSHLCEDNPIYGEMPKEEVLADLSALFLFIESDGSSKLGELNITEIMALLLSIVQLENMSLSDTYTNKYRIDLLYYFLSFYSETFLFNEQEIKNRVNEIVSIFIQANDSSVKENHLRLESWNMLRKIIAMTNNPEAIINILNDRLETLKAMTDWSKKAKQNDEFEDFS